MDSLDKYLGQKEKVSISEDIAVAVVGEANLTVDSRVKDESKWWSYNEKMIKRSLKMGGGLSILGDVGAFYYMKKIKELLEYESSLPKQFDTKLKLKGLCLYHQKDFDRLSEEQKQELVKHHGMAVRLEAH